VNIRDRILTWARNREPDFVIGGHDHPYLRRHWLIPRNRFFNVYVHEFLRSDDDRALHDHPWLFNCSVLLDGEYIEHTIREGGVGVASRRVAGDWKFRWGRAPHRVELIGLRGLGMPLFPCWTVFITGPVVRVWGFHCSHRWIPWREFVDDRDAGRIGKGCEQ
jgi:DNA-binding transcriptional LysR family regulator